MHQTAAFGFAHVDGARVLEMKYGKSDLAMDVVLPDDVGGLSKIEAELGSRAFATWTSSLSTQRVAVSMPKVKIDWGGSVKEPLEQLGMRTAFDERAGDFSGIAPPRETGGRLHVSNVFHEAFAAIDEKGTEAAAATAVVIARETAIAITPPSETFDADHPFLFVIRDVKRGRILFMGRVDDPRA